MSQGQLNPVLDTREAPRLHRSHSLGFMAAITPNVGLSCHLLVGARQRSRGRRPPGEAGWED